MENDHRDEDTINHLPILPLLLDYIYVHAVNYSEDFLYTFHLFEQRALLRYHTRDASHLGRLFTHLPSDGRTGNRIRGSAPRPGRDSLYLPKFDGTWREHRVRCL